MVVGVVGVVWDSLGERARQDEIQTYWPNLGEGVRRQKALAPKYSGCFFFKIRTRLAVARQISCCVPGAPPVNTGFTYVLTSNNAQ